jgi:hypothetical protein
MNKHPCSIRISVSACLGVAAAALFTGCHSIGPHTVSTDRFDYRTAIVNSWKQQ